MRAPTRGRMISIMAWGSTIMLLVISIGFLVPNGAAQLPQPYSADAGSGVAELTSGACLLPNLNVNFSTR